MSSSAEPHSLSRECVLIFFPVVLGGLIKRARGVKEEGEIEEVDSLFHYRVSGSGNI